MDEIKINEHILKLSGRANIPQGLFIGKAYKISIDGEVTSTTDSNNQDGTCNRVYKYEPITVEIKNEYGDTIKTKDVRKRSVQVRKTLWKFWMTSGTDMDFETFYDECMKRVILLAPEISKKVINDNSLDFQ
jgi:hypothetical protein